MAEAVLQVEVVYALAGCQKLLRIAVREGCNAREAVLLSGMHAYFPELDIANCPLGIFGKVVSKPEERLLEEGDRVEIYRPLIADPKEVRKQRAAKAAKAAQARSGESGA